MDVGTYLQSFENSLHNYSGDDPLDPWDRFVKFLEGTLPLEERKAVSVVLDRLVQRFLHEERYQNDPRYVDNCIKCASLYDDPIKVYSYLNSQGIGTRAAALYIAWAQQFEKDGQLRQAEAVYQIAVENQAQPVDTVLQHYGMFQSKVLKRQAGTTGMHAFSKDVPRNPLQNSQLTNQQSRPREILQCKESDLPQFPDNRTVHIISKSECNPPKAQSEPSQQVSMYYVSEVVCEGTEYSFEELRANRYFAKCKQQTELRRLEEEQRKAQEAEDKLREMQDLLKLLDNKSPVQPAHLQAPSRPHDGQQEGLTAASAAAAAAQPELTTLTARTSAAHSNHLRHQLAPTFRLQLGLGARHKSMPFSSTVWEPAGSLGSLQPSAGLCPLKEVEASCSEVAFPQRASMAAAWSESSSPSPLPAVDAAFTSSSLRSLHTSLQHHHASNGHENMATLPIHRQEAAGMSEVPCGALNQMNHSVLTRAEPLQTHSNSFVLPLEEEHVVSKHGENADRSSEGANNVSQGNHSHITPNNSLGLIQATPSRVHPSPTVHTREALDLIMNMFQAPTFVPEVLSDIAEQSLNYGFPKTNEPAGPQPAAAAAAAAASSAPFTIFQDEEDKENGGQTPAANKQRPLQVRAEIPVSGTSQQNETGVGTESVTDETAMWGSRRHSLAPWPNNTQDFAQSAHLVSTPFHLSAPHSAQESVQENDAPTAFAGSDENHPFMRQPTQLSPIMEQSPADDKRSPPAQAPAPTVTPRAPCQLVSDPWDDVLINSLLSRLATPLTSLPNVSTWDCSLPSVSPKMTTTMAGESLRVDFVLGQGAFATVYQATNLTTSEKFFLKVQKPANPWEYYISMKLNIQLRPSVRHLFTNIHSAHLFKNGSILLGDLHNCGTLLNAINLYKSRSEKVMPQALVLYFTSCILHMVDELHSARIVHADIKPDNFMLGERFLENECFDPENTEHGLALIDLGQSIDMSLFPEGTAFTAKCMTSAFQCTEMLSGRPWNYQTDYFGIAGTVYCMIFGSYMQVKNEDGEWKPNGTFKRNPHRELWLEFFHTLLNVPDCSSLPSLQRLRSCVHAELQTHYGAKLRGIKNRLVVQLLESRSGRR